MASYADVTLLGHAGRDSETKYLPSGTMIAEFSMATTESWLKDGEWQNKSTWWRVTVFGKAAERVNVLKGDQVEVHGTMVSGEDGNPRVYQRKDGTSASNFEVKAFKVINFGKSAKQEQGAEVDDSEVPF